MRIKKRNIRTAIFICFMSFLIYSFVHFSSEEQLLEIGNEIEGKLRLCSNIQVTDMQVFITTIMSGIFASSLVALFFYVQEYQREKEVQLLKVIKLNGDICKFYKEIPHIEYDCNSNFGKLAIKYYIEYYNNKKVEDIIKDNDEFIKKIPKSKRRKYRQIIEKTLPQKSNVAKTKLLSYIKNNPNVLSTNSKNLILKPEEKLYDIIQEFDYKLEKAVEVYRKILSIDLAELEDILDDIDTFWSYGKGKREFLKEKIHDNEIYPALYWTKKDVFLKQVEILKSSCSLSHKIDKLLIIRGQGRCSIQSIIQRIYDIQMRGMKIINNIFDYHDLEELQKYDKESLVDGIMTLQTRFLENGKSKFADKDVIYTYNKFVYYMINLDNILLYDLTKRFKYNPTADFAILRERFEGGSHIKVKVYQGKDVFGNLYEL